jgi:hypothetical protein
VLLLVVVLVSCASHAPGCLAHSALSREQSRPGRYPNQLAQHKQHCCNTKELHKGLGFGVWLEPQTLWLTGTVVGPPVQEWTVGPIPTADNVGKEVIVRTSTDLRTGTQSGLWCCWTGAQALLEGVEVVHVSLSQ